MKFFLQFFSSLILLSLVLVVGVGSISSNGFNITRGSSISTYSPNNEEPNNTNSYWLSPSGNIAFGFYPLCSNPLSCNRFIVGIWFIKSSNKTLVWTANRNNPPLRHPSTILLNNDGKLVVKTADRREKPLMHIDIWEPATYAMMLDNGNFVLYDSNSTIIWESFDYPTDTILGGQTLKSDQSLISSFSKFNPSWGSYELRIQNRFRGNLGICNKNLYYISSGDYADCGWDKKVHPMIMKLDSTTGRLYIVNWDTDIVLNNISQGVIQPQQQEQGSNASTNNIVLYRATVDMDGYFRLYMENISTEGEKSIILWPSASGGTNSVCSLVPASITLGISFMFYLLFLFN